MTLVELRTEAVGALSRPNLSQSLLTSWANRAFQEFAYALKFHELETTQTLTLTAGMNEYAFASDFRMLADTGIRVIAPTDSIGDLIPESRDVYRRKVNLTDTGARGLPRYFHRFGNGILLRPVPDLSTYEIEIDYWKTFTFVADGDVSPLNPDWDEVILLGMIYRGFRHFKEFDRWMNVRNDYLANVRSRASQEDVEPFPVGGIDVTSSEQDYIDQ